MGDAGGGGGAGPLLGVWPPGEGADLLLLRELCRCGSSGAASPPPVGPLLRRYGGGGGARVELEEGVFPPEVGGRLLLLGDGGGLEGRGGVLLGVGGRGFSLL